MTSADDIGLSGTECQARSVANRLLKKTAASPDSVAGPLQLTAPLTRCHCHKRSDLAGTMQSEIKRPLTRPRNDAGPASPSEGRGAPERTVIRSRPTGGKAGANATVVCGVGAG